MCSFLRPLHTMPCLWCCHFHVAGVYARTKFVACSQKDMACPIIVDRHKLSGASISCFCTEPMCSLWLAGSCLPFARYCTLSRCHFSCVLYRAHVLFVAHWFLLAFRLFLHLCHVDTFGSRWRASICIGNCALEVFVCCVLSSCCW